MLQKCETRALKNLKDTFKRVKDVTKCPFNVVKDQSHIVVSLQELFVRQERGKMKKLLLLLMFASMRMELTSRHGRTKMIFEEFSLLGKRFIFVAELSKFDENKAYIKQLFCKKVTEAELKELV